MPREHILSNIGFVMVTARMSGGRYWRIATSVAGMLPLRVLEPPIALPRYSLALMWHPRHDRDPAHAWMRSVLVEASAALPPV